MLLQYYTVNRSGQAIVVHIVSVIDYSIELYVHICK